MNMFLKLYYFFILLPIGFVKNRTKDPMDLKFEDKESFYHFEPGAKNEK